MRDETAADKRRRRQQRRQKGGEEGTKWEDERRGDAAET